MLPDPRPGPPAAGAPLPAPARPTTREALPASSVPDSAVDSPDLPPQVGQAVARLAQLDGLPQDAAAEHVAVYEDVHRLLQDALAGLDER